MVLQCSMQVGDERRATRGMEDLDFHIGDEAMNVGNPYAVKVRQSIAHDIETLLQCNYVFSTPSDTVLLRTGT